MSAADFGGGTASLSRLAQAQERLTGAGDASLLDQRLEAAESGGFQQGGERVALRDAAQVVELAVAHRSRCARCAHRAEASERGPHWSAQFG